MESPSLAPIVLFVYNRPAHTKATVEALQKNSLAPQSELYIYSDGPKSEQGREAVQQVRSYLKTVNGFKAVHLVDKESNSGLSASVIAGVSEVLKKHERVIVLEDDLITAADFLEYMNTALSFYQEDFTIYSISGYTFPSPYIKEVKEDTFLYPRPASWGWATWRNRWEQADWEMKDFPKFRRDPVAISSFLKGGEDLFIMLLKQQKGLIESWAIRWTYTHFKKQAYSIYPAKSKVRSIGTDNSGTNLPSTTKYDTAVFEGSLTYKQNPQPDHLLISKLKDFYAPSFVRRFINWYKFGIVAWLKATPVSNKIQ